MCDPFQLYPCTCNNPLKSNQSDYLTTKNRSRRKTKNADSQGVFFVVALTQPELTTTDYNWLQKQEHNREEPDPLPKPPCLEQAIVKLGQDPKGLLSETKIKFLLTPLNLW